MNLWGIIKGLLVQDESDRTKQLSIEVDPSATTATRTTLKSAQTVDRTLNLPDADDTLVGKETTDLLKNKQLEDISTEIVDSVDPTKKVVIDVAGTTGTKTTIVSSQTTDKTITIPDATDTLVAKATTDTLTNKTIGDDLEIQGTTSSTTKDTGALVVQGGVGVEENLNVGGDTILTGDLTVNGTTTSINTTDLEVVDKNITVNKGGSDVSSEGAGLTVERVGVDASLVHEDALTSKWKIGALGSEVEVADVSSAQTLQNKTVDFSTVGNNTIVADSNDIKYDNTISTLTATNVKTAVDEVKSITDDLGTNKADTDLNNLTTTSINQSLIPDSGNTKDLGTIVNYFKEGFIKILKFVSSTGTQQGTVQASTSALIIDGASSSERGTNGGAAVSVTSGSSTGASGSGTLDLKSGNTTNLDSGDITVQTGTSTNGSRGDINLVEGSEGTVGHVWTSKGVNGEGNWEAAVVGSSGPTTLIKTDVDTGDTLASNDHVFADSTTAIFTLNLPAAPVLGDRVRLSDFVDAITGGGWNTNNVTIGRNGSTIDGVAADLTLDVDGGDVELVYNGTTWRVL